MTQPPKMKHDKTSLADTIAVKPPRASSSPAISIDYEKYLSQLEGWNVTEEEKREFISILWNILLAFSEMGFEIHPVQLAQKVKEKQAENR